MVKLMDEEKSITKKLTEKFLLQNLINLIHLM